MMLPGLQDKIIHEMLSVLNQKITDLGGVLIATQRISVLANRYLNNQNSSTNVQTIRSLQEAMVANEKVLKNFELPNLEC